MPLLLNGQGVFSRYNESKFIKDVFCFKENILLLGSFFNNHIRTHFAPFFISESHANRIHSRKKESSVMDRNRK